MSHENRNVRLAWIRREAQRPFDKHETGWADDVVRFLLADIERLEAELRGATLAVDERERAIEEARAALAKGEKKGLIELGWFDPIAPKETGK
jgi:Asp-tRNA(Asn)/Glu-tRNA(Gln) amidotransferase A subunit family amidase